MVKRRDEDLSELARKAIHLVRSWKAMGFSFPEVIEAFDEINMRRGKPRLTPKDSLYVFAQLAYNMKDADNANSKR